MSEEIKILILMYICMGIFLGGVFWPRRFLFALLAWPVVLLCEFARQGIDFFREDLK